MSSNTIVLPTIFREYISAKPESGLTGFPDIINPEVTEFHFVLAFATENYDPTTGKGNGTFSADWNLSISQAESIEQLKNKHKNAKVVISIGGRGTGTLNRFDPDDNTKWLENAKISLKQIIKAINESGSRFHLIDGIDVYYENIVATNDFVDSIGKLIKSLKKAGHIKVASIAPSEATRPVYKELYQNYQQFIDWVDYKFYDQTVADKGEFRKVYNSLLNDDHYPREALLAGFSTDPSDVGKITNNVFFNGCNELFNQKSLPGITIWNADDSKVNVPTNGNQFQVETDAQQMMVGFN